MATHIGLFTGTETTLFNFVTGTFTGMGVDVAADGSTLSYTYQGAGGAEGSSGTWTITGGTGRFEGATGSGTFVVVGARNVSIGSITY